MNADELSTLIDQRFQTLSQLLELSHRQVDAIAQNRLSDLMRILSDKQAGIARLIQIARALSAAATDDPEKRRWASESDRRRCQDRQSRCDQMHQEMLDIEADCQARLEESRSDSQAKLQRLDSGHQAATTYAQAQSASPRGGSLDLSSD